MKVRYLLLLLLLCSFVACRKKDKDRQSGVKGVWECTGINRLESAIPAAPDTVMYFARDVEITYTKGAVGVLADSGYDLRMKYVDMGVQFSWEEFPQNTGDIIEFNKYINPTANCGSVSKKLIYYPDGDSIIYSVFTDGCGESAIFSLSGRRKM